MLHVSLDTKVLIRPARLDDLEFLVQLLRQLFEIEVDFTPCERRQHEGLRLLLADNRACVLVAELGGKVHGMCTAQLVISTAEGGYSAWVEDVVVRRSWRGVGIGRLLMEGITQWAQARGAKRLQLLADRDNDSALGFYEYLGWRPTQLTTWRRLLGAQG
jgi:GNAT superfamily N-acetyltransferase